MVPQRPALRRRVWFVILAVRPDRLNPHTVAVTATVGPTVAASASLRSTAGTSTTPSSSAVCCPPSKVNSILRAIADVCAADDAGAKFANDFAAAFAKVMDADRFDLA
jgi:hypothetical protein